MNKHFEELFEYVQSLKIIDTHEHLPAREDLREKRSDFLQEYLSQYFQDDLFSAGLSRADYQKIMDADKPLQERWQTVEPYWEACRFTGYGRALDIAVKGLYKIDGISVDTLEAVNEAFLGSLQPGHFRHVLKDKCNIEISLLDSNFDYDPELFRTVFRLDHFIVPKTGEQIDQIERESGLTICSFEDWLSACEICLDQATEKGAIALKSALAYLRPLDYRRVTRAEAEVAFNEIWKRRHYPDWEPEVFTIGKDLQDYMMHTILRLANQRGMTMQIHTGIQAGTGNHLRNSDPTQLTEIFLTYPNVKFDLFHIAYPFEHHLSALAKMFPNVYIDMCWAHILSPAACVSALYEWFDSVPLTKISAFGGDYAVIDAVYGHQYLARQNVSKALAMKINEGILDLDRAKQIAKMWFYDNPMRIFSLKNKL